MSFLEDVLSRNWPFDKCNYFHKLLAECNRHSDDVRQIPKAATYSHQSFVHSLHKCMMHGYRELFSTYNFVDTDIRQGSTKIILELKLQIC